jgi:hypothetical protein
MHKIINVVILVLYGTGYPEVKLSLSKWTSQKFFNVEMYDLMVE